MRGRKVRHICVQTHSVIVNCELNPDIKLHLWASCLFKTVHHQQGLSHCHSYWVGAAKTHALKQKKKEKSVTEPKPGWHKTSARTRQVLPQTNTHTQTHLLCSKQKSHNLAANVTITFTNVTHCTHNKVRTWLIQTR